jgi:N-acetylmuramoyl-L-alanine amidase
MRNAADVGLLEDPAFRQQMAAGIADGLLRFVRAT